MPSSPVINNDDPQLLFVNAGMNPFKDYFLGHAVPPAVKMVNSQRCLRVSGKHNDLEAVGFDTYHHTFFEMLGNWSFGAYFKQEAIAWAWEFVVEHMGLPKSCLYATVFAGDKYDGLEKDEESAQLWRNFLPKSHILFCGKADNFWEMGGMGPCGPCTELHIDIRAEADRQLVTATELINKGHPEVIELWNLVFMQHDRRADGSLHTLPTYHVDTGMGFERLCMVVQGKRSAYDTDIFLPVIEQIAAVTGRTYGEDEQQDVAFRVVADHVRAVACAMGDGGVPGPSQAGYVLRRLLRRALRYGHTFLGCQEPFLHELLPTVQQQYEQVFPALKAQLTLIKRLIKEEECTFMRTLEKGLQRLTTMAKKLPKGSAIDGKDAFELYDTYGFPFDLTLLIAKERGFSVDEVAYATALQAQRKRTQLAATQTQADWVLLADENSPHSDFVGYDQLDVHTHLLRYRKCVEKEATYYELVLAQTPFYPAGGGQIGDTGKLFVGKEVLTILDTQKRHALIVHKVAHLPIEVATPVHAVVDPAIRMQTQCNHTATHLLHAALRQVLGQHVMQRGSRVGPTGLRFDFSHYAPLAPQALEQIEQLVNDKIRKNLPLQEERAVPLAVAKEKGAHALFGEKYGEKVRMITFGGPFSMELCGGTHVPATGHLGLFKLQIARGLAAGVRRIEALTAAAAVLELQRQQRSLHAISALLKHPVHMEQALKRLLEEQKVRKQRLLAYEAQALAQQHQALKQKIQPIGPFQVLITEVNVQEAGDLRTLSFALGKGCPTLLSVLVAAANNKPYVAVYVDKVLAAQQHVRADVLCKQLAVHIGGSGGGQSFFAMAGGKGVVPFDKILAVAKQHIHALFEEKR